MPRIPAPGCGAPHLRFTLALRGRPAFGRSPIAGPFKAFDLVEQHRQRVFEGNAGIALFNDDLLEPLQALLGTRIGGQRTGRRYGDRPLIRRLLVGEPRSHGKSGQKADDDCERDLVHKRPFCLVNDLGGGDLCRATGTCRELRRTGAPTQYTGRITMPSMRRCSA